MTRDSLVDKYLFERTGAGLRYWLQCLIFDHFNTRYWLQGMTTLNARKRLSHWMGITAYIEKRKLGQMQFPKTSDNQIDGGFLGLRREMPHIIKSTDDWCIYVSTILGLDANTCRLYQYCVNNYDLNSKTVVLHRHAVLQAIDISSSETFYLSVKALCYIGCIRPSTVLEHYHINLNFFIPVPTFKVSLYYQCNIEGFKNSR